MFLCHMSLIYLGRTMPPEERTPPPIEGEVMPPDILGRGEYELLPPIEGEYKGEAVRMLLLPEDTTPGERRGGVYVVAPLGVV